MNVLIHTHGIGDIDYSSMVPADLTAVERYARESDVLIVPGVFLARDHLDVLEAVLQQFHAARENYPHILGFSIEGPLLGNSGGVPSSGIWVPSPDDWRRIAALGALGLRYVVIGPDGGELDERIGDLTLGGVIELLYASGVRAALGHFQHDNPAVSARRTREVIEFIRERFGTAKGLVLTDHLYNDMPSNVRHAWRTAERRVHRDAELAPTLEADWTTADLHELLGPVPATLLEAARAGEVLPFLNFDGDHVDLEICKKTVEYLTPANLIGITDDTPVSVLAGEVLHQQGDHGLWYRSDGIVAAGSVPWREQLKNLARIGVDAEGQRMMFVDNPHLALRQIGVVAQR
jgi:hypothetical protein